MARAAAAQSWQPVTPVGPAGVELRTPDGPARGMLAIGHGAGGGCEAGDVQALARAAVADGWQVVLVTQPWRLAGRRVATPPARLDAAWTAVLAEPRLRQSLDRAGGRLVVAGRSAGARVACRTAAVTGARAVCCLAFPLHPPGRPDRSRLAELLLPARAGLPVLVLQGERDPFGGPAELTAALAAAGTPPQVHLEGVPGDHGLKADPAGLAVLATGWLARL
jgi:uncharacterized protein